MSVDFTDVCTPTAGPSGISANGLPPLPDPEALDTQARALATSGEAVHSGINDAARSWAGLSGAYEAPEAGQVLAGFGPVFTQSRDLAALTGKAATALAAYADRARELKQRINTLRADIQALDATILGNDDWQSNLHIVDQHRETMDKASALAQAILDSDASCATELSALTCGQSYTAARIPRSNLNNSTDVLSNVFNHVQHFYGTDEKLPDLPWGPPNVSVRLGGLGSAGQGFVSALIGAGQGLHTLLGTNDHIKQAMAWHSLFALGGAVLTTKNVLASGGKDMTANDAQALLTTAGLAKETIHYDEWGTDPWHAAGATTFDVASMLVGGGSGAGLKAGSVSSKAAAAGEKALVLSKSAAELTGAARAALGETTAAVTAKLAKARTALWNNGIGSALEKLDTGLAKLNQTLDGLTPQPAHAGTSRIPESGSPFQSPHSSPMATTDGLPDPAPASGHPHGLTDDAGNGPLPHPDDAPTPKDQLYGKPLSVHSEHAPYPEATELNQQTMELVADSDAPWGRSDSGHGEPLTKNEYDKRYTVPSPDGKSAWDNYPTNAGAVRGSRQDFLSLKDFVVQHGHSLDRIGDPNGAYLGVMTDGKPAAFEARSLPVNMLGKRYFQYRLAEDWPVGAEGWSVELSKIAPAFGREGGALQVLVRDATGIEVPVIELLRRGVLLK